MDTTTLSRGIKSIENLVLHLYIQVRAGVIDSVGSFTATLYEKGKEGYPATHLALFRCAGEGFDELQSALSCVDFLTGRTNAGEIPRLKTALATWILSCKGNHQAGIYYSLRLEIRHQGHWANLRELSSRLQLDGTGTLETTDGDFTTVAYMALESDYPTLEEESDNWNEEFYTDYYADSYGYGGEKTTTTTDDEKTEKENDITIPRHDEGQGMAEGTMSLSFGLDRGGSCLS